MGLWKRKVKIEPTVILNGVEIKFKREFATRIRPGQTIALNLNIDLDGIEIGLKRPAPRRTGQVSGVDPRQSEMRG